MIINDINAKNEKFPRRLANSGYSYSGETRTRNTYVMVPDCQRSRECQGNAHHVCNNQFFSFKMSGVQFQCINVIKVD